MESLNFKNENNINNTSQNLLIFEFFSGIGGMHEALRQINNIKINNIYPFDINNRKLFFKRLWKSNRIKFKK